MSVSLVLVLDVKTAFAQIRTNKTNYPKVVFLSPTPTPSPLPTFTPTPTLSPTPTPTKIEPTLTPTETPTQSISIKEYLLEEVNKYRQSQGLSQVQSDSNTCDFAKKRAEELSRNFNHDGFKNLPYPSYSKVVENIAMNRDYRKVVNNWINSSGHAQNMREDTPFVCIESYQNFYAYEGWKPQ